MHINYRNLRELLAQIRQGENSRQTSRNGSRIGNDIQTSSRGNSRDRSRTPSMLQNQVYQELQKQITTQGGQKYNANNNSNQIMFEGNLKSHRNDVSKNQIKQSHNRTNSSSNSIAVSQQAQKITVNLQKITQFLDNSLDDSIQQITGKVVTMNAQTIPPAPPQTTPKHPSPMKTTYYQIVNNNQKQGQIIQPQSGLFQYLPQSQKHSRNNSNNSRNGTRPPSRNNSKSNSRNESRNGSSSSFGNQQQQKSPMRSNLKAEQNIPENASFLKNTSKLGDTVNPVQSRLRERGDVSLNQSQLKDWNSWLQRQEQLDQIAKEAANIMQKQEFINQQNFKQGLIKGQYKNLEKTSEKQFFQDNIQQLIQSPQFRGNQELLQLIKQQEQLERGGVPNADNDDDDEQLIIDDYNGVLKPNFLFHFVVGRGGFGKVWKVELKKNRQMYAMKEMSKAKIIAKRSVNSVMNEKQLLAELRHPYLVNMSYAFQDKQNLFLVMDLLTGGDLRFHIGKMRKFKENQIKFFVCCIVIGLEYMHNRNIIHRDIKPENLVLDGRGYVRVTDLGIARKVRTDNSSDTSGTPGYMAPEVLYRQNHGIAVDYFALGVIAYEFMLGRRPYNGRSRKEIRDMILAKQVQVRCEEAPLGWSIEGIDFINKLIQRKPQNRLGFNGPLEVKNHPWLKGVPWDKLEQKKVEPPYVPVIFDEQNDLTQQQTDEHDSQDELIQQNILLLRKNSVQNLFAGYSYDSTQQTKQPTQRGTKSTASTHSTNFNNNILSQIDTNQNYKNF